ncbi:hypothetical protein [Oceanobacillus sp. CAU 1775]
MMNIFIILVIIVAFAAVASRLAYKVNVGRKGYWLVGGYAIILIASVILYLFIPKDEFEAVEKLSNDDSRIDITHKVAYRDQPIDDFERFADKEWTFETPQTETIYLDMDSYDYHIPVLIKEVEGSTSIDVTLYHVESQYKFEELRTPSEELELTYDKSTNRLWIITPGTRYFNYATVAKEFPFTQLSSRNAEEYVYYPPDFFLEELVLYFEVPQGLNLIIGEAVYYEDID